MIRLSVPVRQALEKLSLPVLIAAAFGLMLIGKADAVLAVEVRVALTDILSPIYASMAQPLADVRGFGGDIAELWNMRAENVRLRAENENLRRWQAAALALQAENQEFKAELNWMPPAAPVFTTAPVVADSGGVYARSVLLAVTPPHHIVKGEIALDNRGVVGRVTEVGTRSARVLLITDINSRIPVVLETSGGHAIMEGTNGAFPVLTYWPEGEAPVEGERVVTSAAAGAFPTGLPLGTVHYNADHVAQVYPEADLDHLAMVRLFDYGDTTVVAPEAPLGRQHNLGR
ncbi:rod shape-determining protein MreC [Acidisoma sp.]|uniref:rod shape-determining protein MreC n=1 Tax=Acidisoma sp. TaxID=1872115 RepID=UPI003AFFFFC6